jgi:hypothetical protein
MFLTGSGGTGKSCVVQAVRDFARRWHALSMVCISATSGTAAVGLGGMTYQSAVGFQFNGRASRAESMFSLWRRIGLVIVDEVSLMEASDLFRLHKRLGQLKQLPHLKFGGVHIAFMGDFHQLQIGNGVFVDPEEGGSDSNQDASSGFELWRDCLNCGIELTIPMRQAADSAFAELLERFRINRPSADDIRTINSRIVTSANRPPNGMARPLHVGCALSDKAICMCLCATQTSEPWSPTMKRRRRSTAPCLTSTFAATQSTCAQSMTRIRGVGEAHCGCSPRCKGLPSRLWTT